MLYKRLLLISVLTILLSSCSNKYYYMHALYNAQNPTPDRICSQLTQLIPGNKQLVWKTIEGKQYVLAVTWKADTTYYTAKDKYNSVTQLYSYNTGKYPVFVTLAPYLKEKKLNGLHGKKLTMRLNQLLGLPPQANYAYFMEVWVSPDGLFRPCFSASVTTSTCGYSLSKEDELNTDHTSWLYKYIYDSYQDNNKDNCYPFSHLGYTYDWNHKNKSHVGLSEFVIGKNKNIYVSKIYTTQGYIQ